MTVKNLQDKLKRLQEIFITEKSEKNHKLYFSAIKEMLHYILKKKLNITGYKKNKQDCNEIVHDAAVRFIMMYYKYPTYRFENLYLRLDQELIQAMYNPNVKRRDKIKTCEILESDSYEPVEANQDIIDEFLGTISDDEKRYIYKIVQLKENRRLEAFYIALYPKFGKDYLYKNARALALIHANNSKFIRRRTRKNKEVNNE